MHAGRIVNICELQDPWVWHNRCMRFIQTLITSIVSSAVTAAAVLGFQPMMARSAQVGAEAAAAGSGFSYQGQLKKNGSGVTANCAFDFLLFDAASGGAQVGSTLVKPGVAVQQGLFTVELDFLPVSFQGDERWLEPRVQCPGDAGQTTLPRQKVATVPYAIRALQNWGLSGNAGTLPGVNFIGTTDQQGFEIRTGNQRAWSASRPRTVTATDFGNPVIYTGTNQVGGASQNVIASGTRNVIAGGGGVCPTLDFAGGCINQISGVDTVLASIAGGGGNVITASKGAVGGGQYNQVTGEGGTVAGGISNKALGPKAAIAGGFDNRVDAGSAESFVGGGFNNTINNADHSVIAGGFQNVAEANFSAIGGGSANYARGDHAVVPGGYNNFADGKSSFAAGSGAAASHDGTFVWADSQSGQVASTAKDQVVIRAQGGLRWAGSGLGATGSPAVIHQATACDNSGAGVSRSSINHPLLNGNPNAIVVVTTMTGGSGGFYQRPVGVSYEAVGFSNCPAGRWIISALDQNSVDLITGAKFSIWFVLP